MKLALEIVGVAEAAEGIQGGLHPNVSRRIPGNAQGYARAQELHDLHPHARSDWP